MIYASTPKEIETRRRRFIRKWRLKCRAVADSLEEAGERLFTFIRLPDSQWRSARTTDEIDKAFFAQSAILHSHGRTAWRRAGFEDESPVAQPSASLPDCSARAPRRPGSPRL